MLFEQKLLKMEVMTLLKMHEGETNMNMKGPADLVLEIINRLVSDNKGKAGEQERRDGDTTNRSIKDITNLSSMEIRVASIWPQVFYFTGHSFTGHSNGTIGSVDGTEGCFFEQQSQTTLFYLYGIHQEAQQLENVLVVF